MALLPSEASDKHYFSILHPVSSESRDNLESWEQYLVPLLF